MARPLTLWRRWAYCRIFLSCKRIRGNKGDTEKPEIYWKTRTCGTTEGNERKKRDKQKGKRGCREIWI
jgi:hypothetical protein